MATKRMIYLTVAVLLVQVFFARFVWAQMTRLNVGYSAASADQLPAWVAKDSGIFAKNGLDVDLIFFTGGTTAILALVSGDVPITQVSGPPLVNSALAGSEAVFVAAGIISLNYVLMGKPGIKTAEQLKGGTVAISRFGSATDSIARFALRRIGLTPGKDITIVQVGSGPERLSAALTGRVTASVINPPSSFIAEKRGLSVIADVAKMGLVFQHTGAGTTRRFIKEHPDTVRRYVKAHVEAVHKMWTDKEATIKALSKYMGSGLERETLEKSYDNVMTEALYPKKQYPSLEGLKTVIEDVAERDPRAKSVKPEQYVDFTFIKELDQSGYIDGLYKKKVNSFKPFKPFKRFQSIRLALNELNFLNRLNGLNLPQAPLSDMLTDKKGEAAARDIEDWANLIAGRSDPGLEITVYDEADSNTYVLRLAKGARVLIFRLSGSQVRTDGREVECERTLQRKIQDLRNLL